MDMSTYQAETIQHVIEALPASARAELIQFIDYLRYKYGEP